MSEGSFLNLSSWSGCCRSASTPFPMRNSLAETVVFGKVLGEHLVDVLDGLPSVPIDRAAAREHLAALDALAAGTGSEEAEGLIEELRDLVWDHAGIVRTGD